MILSDPQIVDLFERRSANPADQRMAIAAKQRVADRPGTGGAVELDRVGVLAVGHRLLRRGDRAHLNRLGFRVQCPGDRHLPGGEFSGALLVAQRIGVLAVE